MSGHFIVIEGLEGAGKSSAVDVIRACIDEAGLPHTQVREPGGTPLAEALRNLIKQSWREHVSAEAELLVMYAARVQLVRNVIQPALARGEWVIGDRHDMSSQAYQGGGRQLSQQMLAQLKQMTLGDFLPNLTIYLDINPAVGLQRARGRGELDRIELENLDFFERTRARYLELAEQNPNTHIVNAEQPLAQVQQDIRTVMQQHLSLVR